MSSTYMRCCTSNRVSKTAKGTVMKPIRLQARGHPAGMPEVKGPSVMKDEPVKVTALGCA
eukprot:2416582-Amphidinium_carterae.1